FRANQVHIVVELTECLREKSAASGQIRQPLDFLIPVSQLPFLSDGIDRSPGLAGQRPDFGGCVPAAVILAVGNQNESAFSVFCDLDFFHSEMDRIVKRGPPARLDRRDAPLQAGCLPGETLNQRRLLIEAHKKKLIIRSSELQETEDRSSSRLDIALHARAYIEKNSQADGSCFLAEGSNRLRH